MDTIISIPDTYDKKFIETHRIFPLIDNQIEEVLTEIHRYGIGLKLPLVDEVVPIVKFPYAQPLVENFKDKFQNSLEKSNRNKLINLNTFCQRDVILGCTQYIDNLYIRYGFENIQILEGEYVYHQRLHPTITKTKVGNLNPDKKLIISLPFVNGSTHIHFNDILEECLQKNIEVHIDGAWITAAKNIFIDFNHPAISSVGISMSKGYGLSGWNRIGIRWSKNKNEDSITLMNQFGQIHSLAIVTGIYMLERLSIDHLWNTHEKSYYKVCHDFDLTPTDTIHVALNENSINGISPLLKYIENNIII